MDGKMLLRDLRDRLNESDNSQWFNEFTAYSNLYKAACMFVERTECLRDSQTITTVAGTSGYTLNADFIGLYLKDTSNREFIRISDGTTTNFALRDDYEHIVYRNQTASVEFPGFFALTDYPTLPATITGTVTSGSSASGGACTLNDATASFASTVSAGDVVHNTTDGSMGYVLSVVSGTALTVALFDGTDNNWTAGDAYVVQPQGLHQIVLDPPPSVSAYTVTVDYVCKPDPVFSDYGMYRFPSQYSEALVQYAFWLYKYRDSQPNFGDKAYLYFDQECRRHGKGISGRLRQTQRMNVNLKVRRR